MRHTQVYDILNQVMGYNQPHNGTKLGHTQPNYGTYSTKLWDIFNQIMGQIIHNLSRSSSSNFHYFASIAVSPEFEISAPFIMVSEQFSKTLQQIHFFNYFN